MILAQIEEWFHSGLAGIRAANGAVAYRSLVIQPKPVGDLTHVKGSYRTPHGTVRSEWTRTDRRFTLTVTVPPNTDAEIWVPVADGHRVQAPRRAQFLRTDGAYAVYRAGSGTYAFTTVPG